MQRIHSLLSIMLGGRRAKENQKTMRLSMFFYRGDGEISLYLAFVQGSPLPHASPWPSIKTCVLQDLVHVLYPWHVFLYSTYSQVRLSSSSVASVTHLCIAIRAYTSQPYDQTGCSFLSLIPQSLALTGWKYKWIPNGYYVIKTLLL